MDEITKKALEEVKKQKGQSESQENPETINESKDEQKELKQNQVKLGKNKIVTLKPWVGKTKKKIKKLFENITDYDEINFNDLIDILIYKHIEEDIYLNEGEQQYLLALLRDLSISDRIKTDSLCPHCGQLNTLNILNEEYIHYKENNLPFKDNSLNIEFVDIKNKKELLDNIKKYKETSDDLTSDNDIEFAMHINIGKDIIETINYLDNLSVKEQDLIIDKLNDLLPECNLEYTSECSKCKETVDFEIDIMNDIFEALLK